MRARVVVAMSWVLWGCGPSMHYITTTDDRTLVSSPGPPRALAPRPGDREWNATGAVEGHAALAWLGLPMRDRGLGHFVPVAQPSVHGAICPGGRVELGVGADHVRLWMAEPAGAELLPEEMQYRGATRVGPTLRIFVPFPGRSDIVLNVENNVMVMPLYRRVKTVAVGERDGDGWFDPYESYVMWKSRSATHERVVGLQQLLAASWTLPLLGEWQLQAGSAVQTQPVFEARVRLTDHCTWLSSCAPPEAGKPTCHAVLGTPFVSVTAPAGDLDLRTTLYGSFNLAPDACGYPETVGLRLGLGR